MQDLHAIQERNARVEADKAWETSLTRRVMIVIGTYIIVCAYLNILGVEQAYLHAFVPAGAYIISTLGLGKIKQIWITNIYSKTKGI